MGRILLSLCAVVVALGLGASSQKGPDRQEPAQQGQAASDQRAEIAPVSPLVAERQGEAGEDQDKASAQPDDIAKRDLKAQQAMAFIAAVQLFLTGVGIWYIRRTLVETEKAVKEASDATDAAHKAVTETSRVGEAQVRAYLSVVGLNYTAKPATATEQPVPGVEIVLNNSGATPAINIAHFCGCAHSTRQEARTFECPEIIPYARRHPTIPANFTEIHDALCEQIHRCVGEYRDAVRPMVGRVMRSGDWPVVVIWGSVLYDDVFGASYRSDYAYVVQPLDMPGFETPPPAVAHFPQRCFQPVVDRQAIVHGKAD